MTGLAIDTAPIAAQLEVSYGIERLRALLPAEVDASPTTVAAILEAAGELACEVLAPLNRITDRIGCRIEDGRVMTAPGHREAWQLFTSQGWTTLDQPTEFGGQGLPTVLSTACQEIFDRACPAFGMMTISQRAAARLIAAHGDADMRAEWLPQLISGRWCATICISETDAGSDVGRIRTHAASQADGTWLVTGEKTWISFGDHDLTDRIGHCLLARSFGSSAGASQLSLFLVPDRMASADGSYSRNAVVVRRIDEKLGLHGSPTCALGFEAAKARLIGVPQRGLAQMFTMISTMRLGVATQGLAVAAGAAEVALSYAEERLQGGSADAPAVPIAEHADVQRMLLGMISRVEILRGLVLSLAVQVDLARDDPDPQRRYDSDSLSQWLLPIAKTFSGETAIEVSSEAIQVLGGAGYVKDWPVEQSLRDARVFTIYEGTSGIQASDLLRRRLWRDKGRGLSAFLNVARSELSVAQDLLPVESANFAKTLELLSDAAAFLQRLASEPLEADAVALNFLRLAAYAATGWIALRLARITTGDAVANRLVAAGRYWLSDISHKAALESGQIMLGASRLGWFSKVRVASATR